MKKIILIFNTIALCIFFNCPARRRKQQSAQQFRYNSVRKLLKKYKRPITMLEVFSRTGELSCKVATKYDAVCVILDPKNTTEIVESIKKSRRELNNIILLKKDISVQELQCLGECEHFDVVFASDFHHHFKHEWQDAIDATLTLGDYIFVEAPPQGKKRLNKKIASYLEGRGGSLVAQQTEALTDAGSIYFFCIKKNYLSKRRWDYRQKRPGEYNIISTFETKKLHKKKEYEEEQRLWHPGINLLTFKKLGGIWPEKKMIRDMLLPFKYIEHNDLHIFNIIIQGNRLVPIDSAEIGRTTNAQEMLPGVLHHFRNVLQSYWHQDIDDEVLIITEEDE